MTWKDEVKADIKGQSGEFEDIAKGVYLLKITGANKFKPDKNEKLGCQIELTIEDALDKANEQFNGRKLWPYAVLEGQWFKILTGKLLWAWEERYPDRQEFLDKIPDSGTDDKYPTLPEAGESLWEVYFGECVKANLDVIATIKVDDKETAKGFGTKYNIYIDSDQTQDKQESEGDKKDTELPF